MNHEYHVCITKGQNVQNVHNGCVTRLKVNNIFLRKALHLRKTENIREINAFDKNFKNVPKT